MPTPAGQAKVERNVDMGIRLFLGSIALINGVGSATNFLHKLSYRSHCWPLILA